jgi:hypothetical protein
LIIEVHNMTCAAVCPYRIDAAADAEKCVH